MRLIDRDAIHWRPDENWELYATAADIRAIPIVDAVIVTRCKDCKHAYINSFAVSSGEALCMLSGKPMQQDDFCSCGESKEKAHADDHD